METMTTMSSNLMMVSIKNISNNFSSTVTVMMMELLKSVNYSNVLLPLKMNGDKPIVQGML